MINYTLYAKILEARSKSENYTLPIAPSVITVGRKTKMDFLSWRNYITNQIKKNAKLQKLSR